MRIHRRIAEVLLGVGGIVAGTAGSAAQTTASETAPLVLRLPVAPRLFALGRTYVALSGPEAIFANPSNLNRYGGGGLFIAGALYGSESRQVAFTTSTNFGRYGVGIVGNWLDYRSNGFPTRPGALSETGSKTGQSLVGGLALSRELFGFGVGATVKYVEERFDTSRRGRAAFDVGIRRDFFGASFGAAVRNLGGAIELDQVRAKLPMEIELGAASKTHRLGTLVDFMATASLIRERGGRVDPGGGVQFTFIEPYTGWSLDVRLGARRVDESGRPGLQPWTLGGSLNKGRFGLDYGFESYRGTGAVQRFSVRIQ